MSEFQPQREFMEAAIEMALHCDSVEHPVGAVVVKDGEIVSRAGNEAHRDPTYHAERLAIASAQITLDSRRLGDCELYSTLEPCALVCAGQILASRLAVVVYGANAADAQQFSQDNPDKSWMTNEITFKEFSERTPWSDTHIVSGFLKEECSQLFLRTPRSAESATTSTGQKLHIVSLKPLAAGSTRAHFTIGEHQYDMEVSFDPEGLLSWFPTYIAKAPACANCERLIFPTQQVAQGHISPDDSGLSHLMCCDSLAGFAGWLDHNAELVPAFSEQQSIQHLG